MVTTSVGPSCKLSIKKTQSFEKFIIYILCVCVLRKVEAPLSKESKWTNIIKLLDSVEKEVESLVHMTRMFFTINP